MTFSRFEPQNVECYPSAYSVSPGQNIAFSVSVKSRADVLLEIYRADQIDVDDSSYGCPAETAYKEDYRNFISLRGGAKPHHTLSLAAESLPLPDDASQNGCRWPPLCSWHVPEPANAGIYFAKFSSGHATAYAMFVVRPKSENSKARILCQSSINTYQAYNAFGGYCLYGPPISLGFRNPISFERPCQLWDYILYESAILSWFDRHYTADYCTNVDLHEDEGLLTGYRLFVSCGHDEYWSAEMRNRIEEYGRRGGNVLFLSGNTCYRPVRYLNENGRQMLRRSLEYGDLGRPETITTGLNWSAGRWTKAIPKRGYVVRAANHWIFEGTGLKDGDDLGSDVGIIGYETDAAVYDFRGQPISPTPSNFVTLATAFLPDWNDWYGRAATMGVFQRDNGGVVVNVGTTGWGRGLLADSGPVHQLTKNIVDRLISESPGV